MTERYTKTFSLSKNLYCASSPIIVESGAIHYDNYKEKSFTQLKFKNISDKKIINLTVFLKTKLKDAEQNISFTHTDLKALPGASFGESIIIPLTKTPEKLSITKISLDFEDGTWSSDATVWKPIRQKKITSLLPNYYQQLAYCARYGKEAKRIPAASEDFWLCTCGTPNLTEDKTCKKCSASLDELKNISADALFEEGVILFANKKSESRKLSELKKAKEALTEIPENEEIAELTCKIDEKITRKKKKIKRYSWFASTTAAVMLASILIAFLVIVPLFKTNYKFVTNGGSYVESIKSFGEITLPTTTRSGYIFAGWYTNPTLTQKANSPFKSSEDVTLYAKWNIIRDGKTFDSASILVSSFNLRSTGDSYYLEFTPTESRTYTFYSTSSTDFDVRLFEGSRKLLASDFSFGDFSVSHHLVKGTTYYLIITWSHPALNQVTGTIFVR